MDSFISLCAFNICIEAQTIPIMRNKLLQTFLIINQAVKEKKASLKISREAREIEGGFVLSYGGIEENCSFDALFASAGEQLQDVVQKILFQ